MALFQFPADGRPPRHSFISSGSIRSTAAGSPNIPPTLFESDHRLIPEPDPPAEARRLAAIGGSPGQRAQYVLDLTIYTDEFMRAVASIETTMARAGEVSAPGGTIVIGEGGTGKTFILTRMLRRYPARQSKLKSFVPVVTIQLTERPTTEDVKTAILKSVGHAGPLKLLSSSERAEDVKHALIQCRTHALLIDEAHHLQLTKGARRNADRMSGPVGEYLISLYDSAKIGFVLLGKRSLADLFDLDRQLSSRWPGRITLTEYAFDQRWCVMLDVLDEALPMLEKADLALGALAEKIHESTDGNFRQLKLFLSEAVRQAAIDGAVRLEEKHFRLAFYLQGLPSPNPFGEHLP